MGIDEWMAAPGRFEGRELMIDVEHIAGAGGGHRECRLDGETGQILAELVRQPRQLPKHRERRGTVRRLLHPG